MLEAIIKTHLIEHLEPNLLLSDVQYGFCSGRSCELQLLRVVNHWTDCFDVGKDIDILYLNLQKAFDKVPHKLLICKLEAYGVNGDILNWIQNFLSNRPIAKGGLVGSDEPPSWEKGPQFQ